MFQHSILPSVLNVMEVSIVFSCIIFKTLLYLKYKKVVRTVVLHFSNLLYLKPQIDIHLILHVHEMFAATLPINNFYVDAYSYSLDGKDKNIYTIDWLKLMHLQPATDPGWWMSVAWMKKKKYADLDFLRLTNPSEISQEHHQYLEMSQAYLVRGSTWFFKIIWISEATYITNSTRMKMIWKLFTRPNATTG